MCTIRLRISTAASVPEILFIAEPSDGGDVDQVHLRY
jgi:hypothetical protein